MALRLITRSPWRSAFLPPSLAGLTAILTPAPGRQDHTTSPYALAPFVIGTTSVHRDPSHVRDDHDTPLLPGRDGDRYATVSPFWKSEIFFILGLDTASEKAKCFARRAIIRRQAQAWRLSSIAKPDNSCVGGFSLTRRST